MMIRYYCSIRCLTLVFAFLVAFIPSVALADLPPRPQPSTTSSETGSNSDESKPIGGYIVLQMRATSQGIWTVVQWQDQSSGWHDIEGWQGTLDDGQQKVWWIDPADFGKGPFRWAVYEEQNGKLLNNSSLFNLPSSAYETISVEIESLPGNSLAQSDKPLASKQESSQIPASSTPSTSDFLPVTGGEPGIISVGKLVLIWGVLLALISRAINALAREREV